MPYVIRVAGVMGQIAGAMGRNVAGRYISAYNPDAHGGRGEASHTRSTEKALRFSTLAQAVAFYHQQSRLMPRRHDGMPNRPLTALTVTFERVVGGEEDGTR